MQNIPANVIRLSPADTMELADGDESVMDGAIERAKGLHKLIARVSREHGFEPTRDWIDIVDCDGEPVSRFRLPRVR